jgi:hypothetical protein
LSADSSGFNILSNPSMSKKRSYLLGLGSLLNPRPLFKGSKSLNSGFSVSFDFINSFACERCFLKTLEFMSFIFSVSLSLENCFKVFIPCLFILLI